MCQKGVLRQRSGKNGTFWSCSNSPDCRATFDDREELLIL
ncbi:topoisomerase DNA-binding C4 zinc finger domain-containing protein [Anaerospora hongkongensis]